MLQDLQAEHENELAELQQQLETSQSDRQGLSASDRLPHCHIAVPFVPPHCFRFAKMPTWPPAVAFHFTWVVAVTLMVHASKSWSCSWLNRTNRSPVARKQRMQQVYSANKCWESPCQIASQPDMLHGSEGQTATIDIIQG